MAVDMNGEGRDLWGVVKSVAEASALLVALLFTAGWSYLHGYFLTFGVELSSLDIPLPETLIYAFAPLAHPWWSGVIIIAIVLVIVVALSAEIVVGWLRRRNLHVAAVLLVITLGAYSLSRWSSYRGAAAARADLHTETTSLPFVRVRIETTPSDDVSDRLLADDLDDLNFLLLAHSSGHYYFFSPIQPGNPRSANVVVYVVADTKVRIVRIQRSY